MNDFQNFEVQHTNTLTPDSWDQMSWNKKKLSKVAYKLLTDYKNIEIEIIYENSAACE